MIIMSWNFSDNNNRMLILSLLAINNGIFSHFSNTLYFSFWTFKKNRVIYYRRVSSLFTEVCGTTISVSKSFYYERIYFITLNILRNIIFLETDCKFSSVDSYFFFSGCLLFCWSLKFKLTLLYKLVPSVRMRE